MKTGSNQVVTKEQASFTELLDHQEAIILDLETLHYYSLNATACFLWKQMRSGRRETVETLSARLASAFQIQAEQAELDTRTFLAELEQYELISWAPLEEPPEIIAAGEPPCESLPAYQPPQLKLSSSLLHVTLSGSSTISAGAITAMG